MKRILFIFCLILVAALFLAKINLIALDPIGDIVALDGTAKVKHSGQSEWKSIKFNDKVFLLDAFKTDAESGMKILLDDDTVLVLAAETELTIEEHLYTPKKENASVVSLVTGSVRSVVGKLFGARSKYEVKTPTAVSGVKGTDYISSHNNKNQKSTFTSVKNQVWVRGNGQKEGEETLLNEGWSTSVGANGIPDDPWQVGDGDWGGILFDVSSFGNPGNPPGGHGPQGREFIPGPDQFNGFDNSNPQNEIIDEVKEEEVIPEPIEEPNQEPFYGY